MNMPIYAFFSLYLPLSLSLSLPLFTFIVWSNAVFRIKIHCGVKIDLRVRSLVRIILFSSGNQHQIGTQRAQWNKHKTARLRTNWTKWYPETIIMTIEPAPHNFIAPNHFCKIQIKQSGSFTCLLYNHFFLLFFGSFVRNSEHFRRWASLYRVLCSCFTRLFFFLLYTLRCHSIKCRERKRERTEGRKRRTI